VIVGLGLLAGKLLQANKAITEQTDEVYKAYQQMAQIGATGAGAMQDVFDGLMKVGMGTEKFADYIKMINESATDLAAFGGTVNKGRRIFEDTMASLSDQQRVQMEQMGLDRKAQSEAVMTYIKQQRLLTAGTKSQMDLSSAAVMRYIKETDELTRITGANREEQQKLLDKAMSEEIFASFLDELESQGEEGKKRAQQIKDTNTMYEKLYGPETARGFRDAISGFPGASKASEKFFNTFGAQGQDFIDSLKSTTQSSAELQRGFHKASQGAAETYEQFRGQAQMGATGDYLIAIGETRKSIQLSARDIEKVAAMAREEREKQLADPTTKKMAEQENNVRATQIAEQKTVNLLMAEEIDLMAKVAEKNRAVMEANFELAVQAREAAKALKLLVPSKKEIQRSPGAAASAASAAAEGQRMSAEEAKNVLENGSERDIKAFGGRSHLESIIKKSSTAPAASTPSASSQSDLEKLGLRIKAGDVQREGAVVSPRLIEIAKQIQETIPGFNYFSSFNDQFHANKSSRHKDGLAADFTVGTVPTADEGREIVSQLKSLGASYVLDEYNNPSSGAIGPGHFHVEVPKFEAGGNLRGIGLVGEKGPELAVGSGSITSNNDIMGAFRDMISLLEQNQMALRDIANNSKSTSDTSDQMLRIAQN
jgi:hypothetical protein